MLEVLCTCTDRNEGNTEETRASLTGYQNIVTNNGYFPTCHGSEKGKAEVPDSPHRLSHCLEGEARAKTMRMGKTTSWPGLLHSVMPISCLAFKHPPHLRTPKMGTGLQGTHFYFFSLWPHVTHFFCLLFNITCLIGLLVVGNQAHCVRAARARR